MQKITTRQAFRDSLEILFSRWVALQIAIENSPYTHKENPAEDLLVLTMNFFQHGQVEPSDLASNYDQFISNQLRCEVEDGSPLEISKQMCSLFNEIVLKKDLEQYHYLMKLHSIVETQAGSQVVQEYSDFDSDSDSDEQNLDVEPQLDSDIYPEIDVDGFEMVRRR